jgi:hypothetical protein
MSKPLSYWLSLREAADSASRSVDLTRAVAARLPCERPIRIVDLGSGTGSNVRYLTSRLPPDQDWLLVDADAAILDEARTRLAHLAAARGARLRIDRRTQNLGALDPEIVAGRDLVTASALLDLVSDRWLGELAAQCRAAGSIALFALTYDGRSRCEPAEPEDDAMRLSLNRHQKRSDKGFGPAAGPGAVDAAARAFAAAGYDVARVRSDWTLSPDACDLQRELIIGWADAAREIAPEQSPAIDDWLGRRLAHVDAGRSRIVVGHEDLAAWPPAGDLREPSNFKSRA